MEVKALIPAELRRKLVSFAIEKVDSLQALKTQLTETKEKLDSLEIENRDLRAKLNQWDLGYFDSKIEALVKLNRATSPFQNVIPDVATEKPVAFDSPDHIMPWGTKQDNSKNESFNFLLVDLLVRNNLPLSVLDCGCSGGGFVKTIIELGGFATGLEGSDYSKKLGRAEWATIPDFLHTADISFPFEIRNKATGSPIRYACVTAWEVVEHLTKEQLVSFFKNVKNHLLPNGRFIISVSPNEDIVNGVPLHQTVEEKPWWDSFLSENGFINNPNEVDLFNKTNSWIRWEENAPRSFHYVLSVVN